jgi:adenine modification enzyme
MVKKGYIYNDQTIMFGAREIIGFGETEFYVKQIDRGLAIKTIKENHYSKKVYAGSSIHLGVFVNGELLGVLQYGVALNPASGGSVVEGTEIENFLELNRMWISDKATQYPESRAISASLKYIRGKFPKVKWIQSFADERCGCFGIVYQACSFNYYGEHKGTFWELDGEVYHNIQMTIRKNDKKRYNNTVRHLQANKDKAEKMSLRQFRYIKFLDQRWKNKCLLKEKPYPKHYIEKMNNLKN